MFAFDVLVSHERNPDLFPPQEVRFTLDRCSGAAVMEMEGLGSWLTTEDHSSCEVTGVTPNTDRYRIHVSFSKRRSI